MTRPQPYAPTWRPESPESPCPEAYKYALTEAWDILGVPQKNRDAIFSTEKPSEEWASFARVLAHSLRKTNRFHPAVKDFFRRYPDLVGWIIGAE